MLFVKGRSFDFLLLNFDLHNRQDVAFPHDQEIIPFD
jgi:hypothetical protein